MTASLWGENALILMVVMVAQFCEYIKTHWNVHLKWMSCMIHKLYHNKAVIKFFKRALGVGR